MLSERSCTVAKSRHKLGPESSKYRRKLLVAKSTTFIKGKQLDQGNTTITGTKTGTKTTLCDVGNYVHESIFTVNAGVTLCSFL